MWSNKHAEIVWM